MFLHLSWGNLGHIILWLWKSWKTSSLSERCVSSLYSHVHVSPSACACDSKSSTRQTYLWNTPWKTLWRFCFTSFVLHQWREIKPMNQKMLLQMSVVGKKKKKKRKKKKKAASERVPASQSDWIQSGQHSFPEECSQNRGMAHFKHICVRSHVWRSRHTEENNKEELCLWVCSPASLADTPWPSTWQGIQDRHWKSVLACTVFFL